MERVKDESSPILYLHFQDENLFLVYLQVHPNVSRVSFAISKESNHPREKLQNELRCRRNWNRFLSFRKKLILQWQVLLLLLSLLEQPENYFRCLSWFTASSMYLPLIMGSLIFVCHPSFFLIALFNCSTTIAFSDLGRGKWRGGESVGSTLP